MTDLLDITAKLLDYARAAGATGADALASRSRSVGVSLRHGEIESVETEEGQDVGLRVLIDGRVAGTSGNAVDDASLRALAERAVAMARVAPVDPWVQLATPEQFGPALADREAHQALDLFDPSELSIDAMIDRARACEALGLAQPGISKSGGVSFGLSKSDLAFATSAGFSSHRQSSSFSNGLSLITGTDEQMQRDYAGHSARHLADLDSGDSIALLAAERTARRAGAAPRAGGQLPVLFDPRVAGSLIGGLLGCLNGAAIARGSSFLKDRLGERILPAGVDLVDAPRLRRGRRSRAVDAEGLPTQTQYWIRDGRIAQWLLDLGTAGQLGLASNACAVRGIAGGPSPGASNVTLEGGQVSPAAVIADIREGLYVTEMMGSGLNALTGDYSRGAGGFWIENGELTRPVSEMTVAGNLLDMFADLVLCNDLERRYGIDAPTLLVPRLAIAGPGNG